MLEFTFRNNLKLDLWQAFKDIPQMKPFNGHCHPNLVGITFQGLLTFNNCALLISVEILPNK